MTPPARHLLAITATLAAVVAGCGRGKVEQCNAFIDRANAAQNTINGLKLDGTDPAVLEAEASKIEGEAKAVAGVDLKDDTLVRFKGDYAANLRKLGANVKDLAKLHADAKTPGKTGIEAQAKRLSEESEKIEKDESKLVNDINQYCAK